MTLAIPGVFLPHQALWQRLAMCRDRLAAARFLGSFSPDARRTPGGTVGRYANATPGGGKDERSQRTR